MKISIILLGKQLFDDLAGQNTNAYDTPEYQGFDNVHPTRGESDSEHWKDCLEFCAKYDQNSFDPEYESLPIETFMPMLKNVLSQTKKSIYKAEA